jgi:HEAT repeat protein
MDDESQALIDMVRTSRRPSMRLEAARQLADKRDPDLAPVLLELLDPTNDARIIPVVTVAIAGLQATGEAIAPLATDILDGPPDSRRVFMPLLLASVLGERAVPRLINALRDPVQDVAVNAATQLGQMRSVNAFEPLLDLLRDTTAPTALRGVAAASLGALRDPRALPILAELSATADPELLAGAIDGLSDLRDPAGAEYLEAILDRPDLDANTNRAVRLGLLAMERYREQ